MPLYMNGTLIPEDEDNLIFNGVALEKVFMNGVEVWAKAIYSGPPSPVTITASGTYTAGVDFPAGKDLSICMCGGGGNGGASWGYNVSIPAYGGSAGQVVTGTVNIPAGNIAITIGGPTGSSIISTLTASGGSTNGKAGNGASVTTCGGTGKDGLLSISKDGKAYGGGSSGFGNGGNGSSVTIYGTAYATGGAGGIGSGGGGAFASREDSHASARATGGVGGRGEIKISWS